MTIQLTPQQQQMLDNHEGQLPRVVDPRTNAAYVLVPEEDYNEIREVLEEDRLRHAIGAVALRNAIGRMEAEP